MANRRGGFVTVAFNEPLVVVMTFEFEQSQTQFVDCTEVSHPEQVFLEGADEAFGAAVALGLTDEAGRGIDAQEGEFFLETVGQARGP